MTSLNAESGFSGRGIRSKSARMKPVAVSRKSRRSAAGAADRPLLKLVPLAVVLFAAVVDVILQDPQTGPRSIYGPLLALAGLSIVSWKDIRATGPLYLAVFVCSYLNYRLILVARLSIGPLPVNLVDAVVFIALVAELFRRREPDRDMVSRRTALIVVVVAALVLPAFVTGIAVNGPYDAFRDLRPFLFITMAFFLTRRCLASPTVAPFLLQTMMLAGAFGMTTTVLARMQRLAGAENYLLLREIGNATPTLDFAYVMATAFVICRQSLFRRRWAMHALYALAVVAGIFSFSLTWYTVLLLVPVLCVIFAPLRLSRKITLALLAALIGMVGTGAATLFSSRLADALVHVASQVISQYGHLSSSAHVESRFAGWTAAFGLVPGARLLTGVGMGTRVFIDTGNPQIGIILAGEPTYSTYLIASGLIGVLALLWLQLRLVQVSRLRMRASGTLYRKSIRLGLLVYGLMIIINSFVHNNFTTPQLSFLFGVVLAIGARGDRPIAHLGRLPKHDRRE